MNFVQTSKFIWKLYHFDLSKLCVKRKNFINFFWTLRWTLESWRLDRAWAGILDRKKLCDLIRNISLARSGDAPYFSRGAIVFSCAIFGFEGCRLLPDRRFYQRHPWRLGPPSNHSFTIWAAPTCRSWGFFR